MGLGFELSESFSGSYHLFASPFEEHAIAIALRLGVDGLRRFVRERKIGAEGTIHAEGLAVNATLTGTVTMRLFDERRVPYDLAFEGDDGKRYELRGQRDFHVHDAAGSLTILPASLYDELDEEIGRAVLRFDPRTELKTTVKSFRPRVKVPLLSRGR
jgi:hypothetical protein